MAVVTLVDSVIFNTVGISFLLGVVWCFCDAIKKNRSVEN